ncbi:single-stranded DNA-binding protein [Candidatus Microgenomates bacterium]|nr:MAG: single-stranded DNA-binding protein [Candidatus Microgenomates bacterium]
MARSLNRVQLIGNLTRDPELRYTPQGTAVATFSVATNRQWKTETGDSKDEAEFHRIVAWDKLAEICSQLLKKGSKVYVEGRIQTRKWQTKEGEDRTTVEIVISEMMLLDRGAGGEYSTSPDVELPDDLTEEPAATQSKKEESKVSEKKQETEDKPTEDDIPF